MAAAGSSSNPQPSYHQERYPWTILEIIRGSFSNFMTSYKQSEVCLLEFHAVTQSCIALEGLFLGSPALVVPGKRITALLGIKSGPILQTRPI
jgi:hypothetical protein